MITFIANLTWQLANFNPKFLFPSLLSAKREHPEKWYQQKRSEAHTGQVKVALPDACPILPPTSNHARHTSKARPPAKQARRASNLTHLSFRLTPLIFTQST
jgi:hypothetical protein